MVALPVLIEFLVKKYKPGFLYPWEKMIAIEHRHHMNYYKFVKYVHRCKTFERICSQKKLSRYTFTSSRVGIFNSNVMYLFLFIRSFIRGRDAFNIIFEVSNYCSFINGLVIISISDSNYWVFICIYYIVTNGTILFTASIWLMASSVACT